MKRVVYSMMLTMAACSMEEAIDEETDLGVSELNAAELGFWQDRFPCDANQQAVIRASYLRGLRAAESADFRACLESRIVHDYKRCAGDSNRSGSTAAHAQQVADVFTLNANSLVIGCDPTINPGAGLTAGGDINEFGFSGTERIRIGFTQADHYAQQLKMAALIWHEVAHTHGYLHDDCGYPEGEYVGNRNGMPNIIGDCLLAAGMSSKVVAFDAGSDSSGVMTSNTAQQPFGPGTFAGAGDLAAIGDNRASTLVLGAGMQADVADGSDGSGATASARFLQWGPDRDAAAMGALDRLPAAVDNRTSRMTISPKVIFYTADSYGPSDGFAFGPGTYRANRGELGGLPNDRARSMIVPSGTQVRFCESEGADGRGAGTCSGWLRGHVPDLGVLGAWANGISSIQVAPVVTATVHDKFLGARRSFPIGRFRASLGDFAALGTNTSSLVVPAGLRARICTSEGTDGRGAGTCTVLSRSADSLGALNDHVVFLEVTAP